MSKKAYILVFDRENDRDYDRIHQQITTLPIVTNWFHYLKSFYILISNAQRATSLHNEIKKIMPQKRYFIVEVDLTNDNGWLPQKAWDWVHRQTESIANSNNDNS